MFIQEFETSFCEVKERVAKITATNVDTIITKDNQSEICDISRFTDFGLASLGKQADFPAPFLQKVNNTNPELAKKILEDRVKNYFDSNKSDFCTREFNNKICGVVSSKYAYFDDDQVMNILDETEIASKKFKHATITPERLHLRAIDDNYFKINGDDSELYFCYFIDNSMVGGSSFKVQLGIYRRVCTNGLIIPNNQFTICRQIHKGNKDISAEFNASLAFLSERKEDIKELVKNMTAEPAKIEQMKEEFRQAYLSKKLNLSKKETDEVLSLYFNTYSLYFNTYDGHSKWAMVNAITEFARDLKDINRREYLEKNALIAA